MQLALGPVYNEKLNPEKLAHYKWHSFLPPANKVWGKVIFSQACVKNSVHRGVPGPGGRAVPDPREGLVLGEVPGPGGVWSREMPGPGGA